MIPEQGLDSRSYICKYSIKRNVNTILSSLLIRWGIEDLLLEYNVDLVFWAHEHDFERFWPVYDFQIKNGSLAEPYTNPGAPVHIITGSAVSITSKKLRSISMIKFFRDVKKSMILGYLNLKLQLLDQLIMDIPE